METKYFQLTKRVDFLSNTIKLKIFPPLEVEAYAVLLRWEISRNEGSCIRDCKEI
jgi:hypothetical protein